MADGESKVVATGRRFPMTDPLRGAKRDAKTALEAVVAAKPDKSLVGRLNLILETRGFGLCLYWKHGVLSVGQLPPPGEVKP
jgi:hypothetical protein